MALNSFDIETTLRISVGLLAAAGAMLFAALNLVGAGVSASNIAFAESISGALIPLTYSAAFSLLSLIFTEVAAHPSTPTEGHPHSKSNYLQSAFVFIALNGLGGLLWGTVKLIDAASVRA